MKSLIILQFIGIFITLIIHEMQTLNKAPVTLQKSSDWVLSYNVLQILRVNGLKICSNTVAHGQYINMFIYWWMEPTTRGSF